MQQLHLLKRFAEKANTKSQKPRIPSSLCLFQNAAEVLPLIEP
jgi:hypothetical protein